MEYVSETLYFVSYVWILLLLATTHKHVKQIEKNVDNVKIMLESDYDSSESGSESSGESSESGSESSEEFEESEFLITRTRDRSQSI